jgi:hypothetical protein
MKNGEDFVLVWAVISWYSVGFYITLYGRLTAMEYVDRLGNLVNPMMRTLFPNNDAAPIHTAGTVQPWFEEHEGEPRHLPLPAQSPDLYIIEPLWSLLETRMRNRFPPPTSVKQFEDFPQEE